MKNLKVLKIHEWQKAWASSHGRIDCEAIANSNIYRAHLNIDACRFANDPHETKSTPQNIVNPFKFTNNFNNNNNIYIYTHINPVRKWTALNFWDHLWCQILSENSNMLNIMEIIKNENVISNDSAISNEIRGTRWIDRRTCSEHLRCKREKNGKKITIRRYIWWYFCLTFTYKYLYWK